MTLPLPWLIPLLVVGVSAQAPSFTFAGIGLESDLKAVAARYPHSTPESGYVRLAPEDIHDHVSSIGISGTGAGRRVRITFETDGPSGGPEYPRCKTIESKLIAQFGAPHDIRRFSEEASQRADRIWRSQSEELTLLCFKGARGTYWAEAVQIARR
jgi:hypothetical protein